MSRDQSLRIFISSVRVGLEEERDKLPALLQVVHGYEPITFEQFTAQPEPTRQACAQGVQSSDVYLLVLGANYGRPFTETRLSATEEEFNVAVKEGMPILVMHKEGVKFDERQKEFAQRAEDYSTGTYRNTFTDAADLQIKVVAALEALAKRPTALTWTPLSSSIQRTDAIALAPNEYRPVLAVHAMPAPSTNLSSMQFRALPERAMVELRSSGVISQTDGIVRLVDQERIVSVGTSAPPQRTGDPARTTTLGSFGGISVLNSGQVSAWTLLSSDFIGARIDHASATDLLAPLLKIVGGIVTSSIDSKLVALSVEVEHADKLEEGDISEVGRRSSGSVGWQRESNLQTIADDAVPAAALVSAFREIAGELATRLIAKLRLRRT